VSVFGFGRGQLDLLRLVEDAVRRSLVWKLDLGPARFDFRTDGLDLGEWELPPFLTSAALGHPGFHVAGDVDDSASLPVPGVTRGDLAAMALRAAEARGEVVLRPGDLVRAASLELVVDPERDAAITHPADRVTAVLALTLERGGKTFEAGAIYLRRRGRLSSDPASDRATLAALADRVPADADPQRAARVIGLRAEVSALKSRLEEAVRARTIEPEGSADHFGWWGVWRVIELDELANLAARYGYEQARLEVAAKVEPLALARVAHKNQARAAGRRRSIPARNTFITAYLERHPAASNYEVSMAYINTKAEAYPALTSVERSVKRIKAQMRERGGR
jgi:hypothetical protein